jgi:hypothetical protein
LLELLRLVFCMAILSPLVVRLKAALHFLFPRKG